MNRYLVSLNGPQAQSLHASAIFIIAADAASIT